MHELYQKQRKKERVKVCKNIKNRVVFVEKKMYYDENENNEVNNV